MSSPTKITIVAVALVAFYTFIAQAVTANRLSTTLSDCRDALHDANTQIDVMNDAAQSTKSVFLTGDFDRGLDSLDDLKGETQLEAMCELDK